MKPPAVAGHGLGSRPAIMIKSFDAGATLQDGSSRDKVPSNIVEGERGSIDKTRHAFLSLLQLLFDFMPRA